MTTTTPPSAWSRLVQITRTASESSLTRSTGFLSKSDRTSSPQTHSSTSVQPAKRRRLAESPPPRPTTDSLTPLFPEPNDTRTMPPKQSMSPISRPPISEHDCITACPCRVEDVDCVASQQWDREMGRGSPHVARQSSTSGEIDQETPRQKLRTRRHPSPAHQVSNPAVRLDRFGPTRNAALAPSEKHKPEKVAHSTGIRTEVYQSDSCESSVLEDDHAAKGMSTMSEPLIAAMSLKEGDQNSVNKTPVSKRLSLSSINSDESFQLATPSSSPAARPDMKANEFQVDAAKPHKSAPAAKTKRRLTLYGNSYDRQTSNKKRKTPSKRKDGVQTTLSLAIGSSAGMRECKVCDTVYNPFHPEDVKVHAKRHALVVKEKLRSEEVAGVSESSLVE